MPHVLLSLSADGAKVYICRYEGDLSLLRFASPSYAEAGALAARLRADGHGEIVTVSA